MNNLEWLASLPDKNIENVKQDLTLPQLPQLLPEKLGRLEANNDAVPQLPQPAPTVFNEYRAEKAPAAHVEGAGSEINSAAKSGQSEAWAAGFLSCWQLLFDAGLLVLPAQQSGLECLGCQHLAMTTEHWPGTRRKFFIRCDLGYRQLETGYAGQRITIAPSGCDQYSTSR